MSLFQRFPELENQNAMADSLNASNKSRKRPLVTAALGLVALGWILAAAGVGEARLGAGVHPILLPKFTYMGNASCGGNGCHSEDKPKLQSGKNIGDESNIWAASDPHHEAFKTLSSEASTQIADKLHIPDATISNRCQVCHAMDVPTPQRGEQFTIEDAVGCESCHGPSQKWLKPHAEEGWTPKKRQEIGAKGLLEQWGLADTSNLEIRAHTCVACHLQIDKDMIDAGHPPLEFEMYAYNYYISKKEGKEFKIHWDEPTGQLIDARLWAIGQAAALDAAKAQVESWKRKGWETADAVALVTIYQGGVDVAKKNFGADTAAGLIAAKITPEQTAAAARDLAKLAAQAATPLRRRIIAMGVTALGSATFDGRGAQAPDEFWNAYNVAIKGETGKAYLDAVNKMAELAK